MAKYTGVNKRRPGRIYVEKVVQNDFILKFCMLVGCGALVISAVLYLWGKFSTTVSIVNARVMVTSTADYLLPLLIQTTLIVMIFVAIMTAFMTLYVSHKIAGPIYRFKQMFKELSEGNFTHQVKLRKDDKLQEVAGEFNAMISSVKNHVLPVQETIGTLKHQMEQIEKLNMDETQKKQWILLKQKLDQMEQLIRFFKF